MSATAREPSFARLEAATIAALAVPAALLAADAMGRELGPDPWAEATRQSGSWALRLLLLSLAVTPFRQILRLPALARLRRIVGVGAFAYAALHLSIHLGSIGYDLPRLAAEFLTQRNLLFGALAFAALLPLAATSFDAAVRALGGTAWRRLHRLVFPAAGLAIVHFAISWPQKIEVTEPAVMAGLFAWLAGYRLIGQQGAAPSPAALAGLAAGAGVITAGLEFAWFALRTKADPWLVLAANLDPALAPRPATWVFAAGLAAAALRLLRRGRAPRRAAATVARTAAQSA